MRMDITVQPGLMKSRKNPFPPINGGKIQARGNCVAWACPGKGQIHAAKRSAGFSVAGTGLSSVWPKGKLFYSYKDLSELPAPLGGSRKNALGPFISHRFWRRELSPPPDNKKGFSLLRLDFWEGLCKPLKSTHSTIYQNEEVPDKIFLKDCFSRGPFPGFAGQKPPISFQS